MTELSREWKNTQFCQTVCGEGRVLFCEAWHVSLLPTWSLKRLVVFISMPLGRLLPVRIRRSQGSPMTALPAIRASLAGMAGAGRVPKLFVGTLRAVLRSPAELQNLLSSE
eukprot:767280-Hanusia_phi.AAC.2